jgi:hypothetical protein
MPCSVPCFSRKSNSAARLSWMRVPSHSIETPTSPCARDQPRPGPIDPPALHLGGGRGRVADRVQEDDGRTLLAALGVGRLVDVDRERAARVLQVGDVGLEPDVLRLGTS